MNKNNLNASTNNPVSSRSSKPSKPAKHLQTQALLNNLDKSELVSPKKSPPASSSPNNPYNLTSKAHKPSPGPGSRFKSCPLCFEHFPAALVASHASTCQSSPQKSLNSVHVSSTLSKSARPRSHGSRSNQSSSQVTTTHQLHGNNCEDRSKPRVDQHRSRAVPVKKSVTYVRKAIGSRGGQSGTQNNSNHIKSRLANSLYSDDDEEEAAGAVEVLAQPEQQAHGLSSNSSNPKKRKKSQSSSYSFSGHGLSSAGIGTASSSSSRPNSNRPAKKTIASFFGASKQGL